MRAGFCASLFVSTLALAFVPGGPASSAHPCLAEPPHGPAVPAPIVLSSTCGMFWLSTDGRVLRLPRRWLAHHGSGTGRRFGAHLRLRTTRDGRIHLFLPRRMLWRSAGLYRNSVSAVAFGPRLFAFSSYGRGVFLTDLRSPEHRVVSARNAYLLDFTRAGRLLAVSGRTVILVSRRGDIVGRDTFSPSRGLSFDSTSDTLYFVTPANVLATLRSTKVRRVASVAGIAGSFGLAQPDLLTWGTEHAITVTTRRAEIVASAKWDPELGSADLGVRASSDGMLFAFRVTSAKPRRRNAGAGNAGAGVFVLRRDEHDAREVYRQRYVQVGCGVGGNLSWHGHNLLYDSGQGHAVILQPDTAARVSLLQLEERLPKRASSETIGTAWASDYAR